MRSSNSMLILSILCLIRCVVSHPCHVVATEGGRVRTDCSNLKLASIPRGLPNTTAELLLQGNRINIIRAGDFKGLTLLQKLFLSKNQIASLSVDSFRHLGHLRLLDLRGNPMGVSNVTVPPGTFKQLTQLESLKLGYGHIPVEAIRPLRNLRELYIALDHPSELPDVLCELPELSLLDFAFSAIIKITRELLDPVRNCSVSTLSFRSVSALSYIEPGSFSDFRHLSTVNFACSALNEVDNGYQVAVGALADVGSTPLDTLIMDGISQRSIMLHPNDLCNNTWAQVRRWSMRSNHIVAMHPQVPSCLQSLEVWSMGYFNAPYSLSPMPPELRLELLVPPRLRVIDLSYLFGAGGGFTDNYCDVDDIRSVDFFPSSPAERYPGFLESTPHHFNMSVDSITDRYYVFPPSVEHIIVDNVGLQGTTGRYVFNPFYPNNSVRIIEMSNSHWFSSFPIAPGFANLQFLDIRDNGLESITKPITQCLSSYRLSHLLISHNRLYISGSDLAGIFTGLDGLVYLDMSHNSLSQLHRGLFLTNQALKYLFLSHNEFTEALSLNLSTLRSIKLIDLSYNAMRFLSEDLMKQLDLLQEIRVSSWSLNITGNPFVCDCPAIPFIQWLSATNISITHPQNLTCSHDNITSYILNYPVNDLVTSCATVDIAYLTLRITSSILVPAVVAFVLLVFLYRWRWHLRWYYYSWQHTRNRSQAILMATFDLDAYVIFSYEHDLHFVFSDLRPELEDEFGLNLFLYGRDDLGGGTKGDTVVSGMEQSRMVVAVVTPSFLKDAMCEFALHMSLVKGINSLIVLLKDDPDLVAMSKTLRSLISPGSTVPTFEWPVNERGQNVVIQNIATVIENYGRP